MPSSTSHKKSKLQNALKPPENLTNAAVKKLTVKIKCAFYSARF